MKKILALCLAVTGLSMVSTSNVFAQSESAVPFLLITPGARAAGMGETFVSIADDATATYWNPAGLAFQNQRQIALMHAKWLPQLADDLFYDYGTFVWPIEDLGTFGLSVTYLNLGTQFITGEDSPEVLGTFGSNEFAIAGSFGGKLSDNAALGISLKFIRSNLAGGIGVGAEKGDGKANGFAFDLGYMHKNLIIKRLSLGVNITNMGPKLTYIDAAQADPLPTNLRLGFSYGIIEDEFNRLRLGVEFNKMLVRRNENEVDPWYKALITSWTDDGFKGEMERVIANVGAEYWYNNLIALRTGYHYDEIGKVKYVSFGAGLKYSLYQFDFGYISAGEGHPLSDTMRFSLTIGF